MRDGLSLALLTITAAFTRVRDDDAWVADSFDYAIRMLMLRGMPFEPARAKVRTFFATTIVGRDPHYAPLFARDEPEWWPLFAPRQVYPMLAAALYPWQGFDALVIVPRVAYVLNAPVLYRYLRRIAGPHAAAFATLWYLRASLVRHVAQFATTDALAMLFWTAALDAATCVAREGRGWTRLTGAIALLSFTRPLPYLPLGAGAALVLAGAVRRDRCTVLRGAGITLLATVAIGGIISVLARAGVPNATEHLARVRAAQGPDFAGPSRFARFAVLVGLADDPKWSLGAWYASAVALSSLTSLYHIARTGVAAVAVTALARRWPRPEAALALGAIVGSAGGIVGDPVPLGMSRTVVLPLYPVFAVGLALALDGLWALARARRR